MKSGINIALIIFCRNNMQKKLRPGTHHRSDLTAGCHRHWRSKHRLRLKGDQLIGSQQVTRVMSRIVCHNYITLTPLLSGVSWPSGLAYRTQVLVLAAKCGFEIRAVILNHNCLIIIASLHPGVKWVPVRAELVD